MFLPRTLAPAVEHSMDPALLADIVVVAHLSYVGFAIVGELLFLAGWAFGWEWVRRL